MTDVEHTRVAIYFLMQKTTFRTAWQSENHFCVQKFHSHKGVRMSPTVSLPQQPPIFLPLLLCRVPQLWDSYIGGAAMGEGRKELYTALWLLLSVFLNM